MDPSEITPDRINARYRGGAGSSGMATRNGASPQPPPRPRQTSGKDVPEFSGPLPPTPPLFPDPMVPPAPPPPPPAPVAHGGGHYNPTTAPFGHDMSTPGVREQFWNNNQALWFQNPQLDWVNEQLGQFNDPWQSETFNAGILGSIGQPGAGQSYWNGLSGSLNSPTASQNATSGGYRGPNLAEQAFEQTQRALPGSLQPQFDAYYDRMRDKTMSAVNTQAAARGAYGSSSALNGSIGAALDVEANRAKAGTDFSLADSKNQADWFALLGSQGRAADLSGQGAFSLNQQQGRDELDRVKTYGDLAFRAEEMGFDKGKAMSDIAFGIDDQRLERMGAGIDTAFKADHAYDNDRDTAFRAAGDAQRDREGRISGLYGDLEGMSEDVMGFFTKNYDQLLGADEATFDQMLSTMIAQTADQRGWDSQQQERIFRDAKAAWDMASGDQANKESKGT